MLRAERVRNATGHGLGLAIVRQAAESAGGFAEASNAEGGGALLKVGFGPILAFGPEQPVRDGDVQSEPSPG